MSETKQPLKPREKVVVRNDSPATSGETVTIGCKWPNGFVMRLYDFEEVEINVQGRIYKENQAALNPEYPEYTLNGFSIDLGAMAGGIAPGHEIVGGYGLTHGIPRDFAEAWFEQNKLAPFVKNGIVFMQGNEQRARAHAKEYRGLQSGVQPLDPSNPAERAGLKKGSIVKASEAA